MTDVLDPLTLQYIRNKVVKRLEEVENFLLNRKADTYERYLQWFAARSEIKQQLDELDQAIKTHEEYDEDDDTGTA